METLVLAAVVVDLFDVALGVVADVGLAVVLAVVLEVI